MILERVEQLRGELALGSLTPKSFQMADELAMLVTSGPGSLEQSENEVNEQLSAQTLAAAIGSDVVLRSGSRGTLLAVVGDEATVGLGRMHSAIPIADISTILVSPAVVPQSAKRPVATIAAAKLDLRGARVEDALVALEARISAVLLAGGDQLEIIHGVGTGALRDAVRRKLRELPEVHEVRTAEESGREGVTFAIL